MSTQVWLILLGAILLEVSGTTAMKLSEGFTKIGPSVLMFVFYGASFACLALTFKVIDVSLAYAVWAGLGTALIAIIGFTYFAEPVSWVRVACIALIVVGVFGLNLTGSH
ncbi:MAG: membrane protein [Candidatus Entotheonella factor]|uniref:Membrane protein n=1 Tax=Entotheonella factor TaxID=1429438 RepID=W4LAE3_ENTF1|nr:multidrug efflux SMR transporter [Candidatus Entotheonella palauensis]ETW95068.1 MAG: membrane protein [Candidatus Entotheonella factor]